MYTYPKVMLNSTLLRMPNLTFRLKKDLELFPGDRVTTESGIFEIKKVEKTLASFVHGHHQQVCEVAEINLHNK